MKPSNIEELRAICNSNKRERLPVKINLKTPAG